MTDPNGWPDASKPGYPANPERDGWHWVQWPRGGDLTCQWWRVTLSGARGWAEWGNGHVAAQYRYLGPCHTPAEVAALAEAARREEREANIRLADMYGTGKQGMAASAAIVAAIRARGDA
jgi:hypothetical protein